MYIILYKTNKMKQTAVEWLHEKLAQSSQEELVGNINIWFKQAKEMEKQQQSYSEEEVLDITKQAYSMGRSNYSIKAFNEWFEQFKKK